MGYVDEETAIMVVKRQHMKNSTTQKDPTGSQESNMVGDRGVEPLTSTTSMWRSSQLS